MLHKIQAEIKAPKGQFNKFGNYKYRSCEDIVEAAKPVLNKYGFALTLTDEIVNIGNRFYIKATATITDGSSYCSASAFAREEETKKGMDGAQITGAASSYARKYALNGLFAIDDTKDADATNTHEEATKTTLYNHKELGSSEKPLITNEQFKKLMTRVNSGDLTAGEKAIEFYTLEERQKTILQTALKQSS